MTSLTGNICLALAGLISIALLSPFFQHKISTSNDQGASGYMVIIVMFLAFLFLGVMSMAYFAINRQGGFHWISTNGGFRFLILSLGLLSAVIISAIGIMTRFMPFSKSDFLQSAMHYVPMVVFIVLIGTGFILNNHQLRDAVPLPLYKWPLLLIDGLSLAGIVAFIITGLSGQPSSAAEATRQYENAPSIIKNRLNEIDSADAKADMVRLMELTGALYPQEVREKTSAKIKSNPDWQHDLIDKLEKEYTLECFNFLQSNDVEDKNLFLQPVLKGVKDMAVHIRRRIQSTSPSDLSRDMFSDEVGRVLHTVEKFQGMGVDYLPAVRELRSALDEPIAGKTYKYDCISTLDTWIEKQSKGK